MSYTFNFEKLMINENIRQVALSQINKAQKNLQDRTNPHEGIHEARKCFKKIRALIRLIRPGISKDTYKAANVFFRDLARALSDARDASAVVEVLDEVKSNGYYQFPSTQMEQVYHYFESEKNRIESQSLTDFDDLEKVVQQLETYKENLQYWEISPECFATIAEGIKQQYKKAAEGYKITFRYAAHEEYYHEWRKELKYLRYHVSLLIPLWQNYLTMLEGELHRLTDYLGKDNDLKVVRNKLKETPGFEYEQYQDFYEILALEKHALQNEAQKLGTKLLAETPKSFGKKFEKYYDAEVQFSRIVENSE